jgi:hemin uptake protein HemP
VQLFQGRAKKPKAAKRVRLKVPGPIRVVLRSRKLVKGPYRIVIGADGRRFVRRAVLTR